MRYSCKKYRDPVFLEQLSPSCVSPRQTHPCQHFLSKRHTSYLKNVITGWKYNEIVSSMVYAVYYLNNVY